MRFLGFCVLLGSGDGIGQALGLGEGGSAAVGWSLAILFAVWMYVRARRRERLQLFLAYLADQSREEESFETTAWSYPSWAYDVLAVRHDASPEEIKRAYRETVKAVHPDRNPDPKALSQFRAVQAAYEALGSP